MKKKIAVLGAGMVGRTIANDLCKDFEVTSFDISETNLKLLEPAAIHRRQADLSNTGAYAQMLQPFDIVASAVPGFMGYAALEAIIRAGKNVVDISFFPEDALVLHTLAKEHDVTAIVDCGVAPGMSNLVLGRYNEEMEVSSFHCMVGGLPVQRNFPFEYKAPFSPVDVIEEYTRPARYVEHGEMLTRPALSDPELVHFDKVGTLESFNTDGLRSLMFTMKHIPNMKEKTLRYPGHIRLIEALQTAGFFSEKTIQTKSGPVKPIDVTCSILFDQWKLQPGEPEFTIMNITVEGTRNGKPAKVEYFLYDEYDAATQTSSMSRTTAYTCTAVVNLLASGKFNGKGIFPPELVGSDEACFDFILHYLARRGVHYRVTTS